jgi:flagellin
MTRINTNVPSLVAQNRLQSSNSDLQTALTRLSTGLRINSGADDPAGLIASEALRSEITSLGKAISNTRRASQIISTADSALGEVSNLLNDIRGLVVEAANSGALSDSEIAANQLQVDSSLEAVNRIAQTTTFQGRKLIDGSLSFQTAAGTNFNTVTDLQIDQANLGTTGSVSVDVTITAAAEQAQVEVANIPAGATAVASTADLTFTSTTPAVQATTGAISLALAGDFTLTAKAGGSFPDADLNTFNVNVTTTLAAGGTASTLTVDTVGNEIDLVLEEGQTLTQIAAFLAGNADVDFSSTATTAVVAGDGPVPTAGNFGTSGSAAVVESGTLNITADNANSADSITSIVYNETLPAASAPAASFAGGVLTIDVDGTNDTTLDDIIAAIAAGTDFTAAIEAGGDFLGADPLDPTITDGAGANYVAGVDQGGLATAVVFELQGSTGSEVFNVSAGTTIDELISQINLVSDATGVTAVANGTTLELTSSAYGSDSVVDLKVIEEDATGTFTTEIGAGVRDEGADIAAKVNGVDASGDGNTLKINTSTLDLSITVDDGSNTSFGFTINGGGALFQLGADVVGNQQARIGINSVNTARLGGPEGKLFQLTSGQSAALATDPNRAAKIVTEAINQVTSLRGRLGAFQATTLESNLVSLSETQANLLEAESSIRDADFAQESANLTRAQILVQSGTNVLSLANQNPQNVLSLLR